MVKFIGRESEIKALNALKQKRSASLVVIKGRRRIGKSRLLQEFSKSFTQAYLFSGLPPGEAISAQMQRDEFARQFERQFSLNLQRKEDWGDLFWELSKQTRMGRVLIVLDEITWMGAMDLAFLGKLKNAWDLYFKKNDQLILVLCGSVSTWIEKNILNSTGFLGRESLVLTIQEMPLRDCAAFWDDADHRISAYEKLKVLAVTGGIPRYLENINPALTAENNIQRLCFSEKGILVDEFEKIFSDLFNTRNRLYQRIVTCLADGACSQDVITQRIKLKKGGDISSYLNDLISSGFISRDFTWRIKDGKISNLSYYRLRDNYSRFYLKYILPNKERIRLGNINEITLSSFPGWYSIMGLQIENLVLGNRHEIKRQLKINPADILMDNSFFQNRTKKHPGCQIDYMIQDKHHVLYICEVKFLAREIGMQVIDEVREKIKRLKLPKQFSYRPVLIHVNGVSEVVEEAQYFSDIVDLGEFLTT